MATTTKARSPRPKKPHVHHWVLETPEGPEVKGRCKKCRQTQMFPSSYDESYYGNKAYRARGTHRKSAKNS